MKKFILTALSTAILSACGGGGGDTQPVQQDVKKNNSPSVSIIAEKNYQEQTVVSLQANAKDPDGNKLSYNWTKKSGPEVDIVNNTTSTLTFTAPTLTEEVTFTFEVKVDDNNGGEAKSTHTLTILPVNTAPSIAAGENQTINEQLLVTLKGTASDKDGEITKLEWLQTSGTNVEMTKVSDTEVTFVAPTVTQIETLTFELNATDNENANSKDSVIITVNPVNLAPSAEAGTKQTVNPAAVASLDASQSTDEDGELVSYQWVQTQGSSVELKNADAIKPNFTPLNSQEGETLTFELTVTDNEGAIDKDTVQTYINMHPVANAGKDKIIETGHETTLDASLSQDDGQIVSYNWTQIKGEAIALINADTITPSFTADFADDKVITLQVTVTDDMGLSHSDDVEITVVKVNRHLNDTGITVSADFADGNDTQCNTSSTNNHDCEQGRDAQALAGTLAKTGSGIAGFDFTKLAADGS